MIKNIAPYLSGFALAFLIGNMALFLSPHFDVPAALLSLLAGLALSFLYTKNSLKTGIDWSSKFVLRFGIAFLGFRIVLGDLFALGWSVAFMIVLAIAGVMFIGIFCAKFLGLRKEFGALTGGAVSICGASAAMAIIAVLPDYKDKDRDLSFAIIGITAFSTLEMLLSPLAAQMLGLSVVETGMFLGGTIHDVAQTAGGGYSVSEEVGDMAVLTKMIRVAFILPVVFVLMFAFKARDGALEKSSLKLPLFLVAFFTFMILNSFVSVPPELGKAIGAMSKIALITAIAAIGLKTNIKEILALGFKPFFLIAIEVFSLGVIILSCILYL